MSNPKRIILLIILMTIVTFMVSGITLGLLYNTAMNEQRARLIETVQSQARLIEAIARDTKVHSHDHPDGAEAATLAQIRDAHQNYSGFGKTGEFTLAKKDGNLMVFLLSHRHFDYELPEPVLFDSELAAPMHRALSGESGTVVGLDYRGELVLAAHEPVAELDLGIVVKIDLSEIRAPFIKTSLIAGLIGLVIVCIGAGLFFRVTNPLLRILAESEQRFRSTFEQAAAGIVHGYLDGKLFLVNKRFCDITGYSQAELSNLTFQEITHPDDQKTDLNNVQQLLDDKIKTHTVEKRYIRKDQTIVWVNLTVSLVREVSGKPKYFIAVVEDISERKQADEQIQASLKEKEIMLKEIHHRVKNNLQVISSLLRLQARYMKDQNIRSVFIESQNRIRSMALVHEKLYSSEDLAKIDYSEYINSLVDDLYRSYGVSSGNIALNLKIANVSLDIDLAIPCGLIINELISNSLKYAFPENYSGKPEICIFLKSTADDKYELILRDNGIGIPKEVDLNEKETLGLYLVKMLVEDQLDSEITLNRRNGAEYKIYFKGA